MWHREHNGPFAQELVSDCEAFLAGRFAEHLEARGERVPEWAWSNLLAHGSDGRLVAAALAQPVHPAGSGGWRQARSYLAGEVLETAARNGPLPQLQALVLVPLELASAERPDGAGFTPGQWVNTVLAALSDHRAHSRQERRIRPESTG